MKELPRDTPKILITVFLYDLKGSQAYNSHRFGGTQGGSRPSYGNLIHDGHQAFAANWIDVAPRTVSSDTRRNSFQVILVNRSDVGTGNFDIVFNFDSIQWHNYDGSLDSSLYGGSFFGYGVNGTYYGYTTDDNHLLTLNADQLPYNSLNSDVAGRYVFEVRDGVVTNPLPYLAVIPEPETWAMLLAGLGVVGAVARRRRTRAAM